MEYSTPSEALLAIKLAFLPANFLPVSAIYHGVAVPAGLPVNLDIDLFEMQRRIYE